jgi:hypothetical protein
MVPSVIANLAQIVLQINPFTASCENAMTLSVPRVLASCEKFPHASQLNFWSTQSIFNQFSVFLKTLNAFCVCLQYKHPRSMKRVIRADKPVTLLLLLWSHKYDFGAEPRSRIIATLAAKGLNSQHSEICKSSNTLCYVRSESALYNFDPEKAKTTLAVKGF